MNTQKEAFLTAIGAAAGGDPQDLLAASWQEQNGMIIAYVQEGGPIGGSEAVGTHKDRIAKIYSLIAEWTAPYVESLSLLHLYAAESTKDVSELQLQATGAATLEDQTNGVLLRLMEEAAEVEAQLTRRKESGAHMEQCRAQEKKIAGNNEILAAERLSARQKLTQVQARLKAAKAEVAAAQKAVVRAEDRDTAATAAIEGNKIKLEAVTAKMSELKEDKKKASSGPTLTVMEETMTLKRKACEDARETAQTAADYAQISKRRLMIQEFAEGGGNTVAMIAFAAKEQKRRDAIATH